MNITGTAVLGGAGSALGGGKFENGAVTGAFGYLFNDAAHAATEPTPGSGLAANQTQADTNQTQPLADGLNGGNSDQSTGFTSANQNQNDDTGRIQVAGTDGTPGSNQAQNAQVSAVVRILQLTPGQRQQLHLEISGQNYSYKEILQTAKDMFGK